MSREQIVAELMDESERLQYDEGDADRIFKASQDVAHSTVHLFDAVGAFKLETESPVDEDSADRMKQLRMDLAYAYGNALFQLHKLGVVFRFTEETFDRVIESMKGPEEAPVTMAGL